MGDIVVVASSHNHLDDRWARSVDPIEEEVAGLQDNSNWVETVPHGLNGPIERSQVGQSCHQSFKNIKKVLFSEKASKKNSLKAFLRVFNPNFKEDSLILISIRENPNILSD